MVHKKGEGAVTIVEGTETIGNARHAVGGKWSNQIRDRVVWIQAGIIYGQDRDDFRAGLNRLDVWSGASARALEQLGAGGLSHRHNDGCGQCFVDVLHWWVKIRTVICDAG